MTDLPPLPSCPHCDANRTLSVVRGELGGLLWCECSCCARTSFVKDGRIIERRMLRYADVSNVPMFDP